jgi:hypothetical protein
MNMKSTEQIHEIVAQFGDQDKLALMKALKSLRMQVQSEVKRTYASRIRSAYNSVTNLY